MNPELNNYVYTIMDPTGNITALVEEGQSRYPANERQGAARLIMQENPEVEQVGFVRMADAEDDVQVFLDMAGGEFCGNASMCAAAWYILRSGREPDMVRLRVSGALSPVEAVLNKKDDGSFAARVHMPGVLKVSDRVFSFGGITGSIPYVAMEGISHLVIEEENDFYFLSKDGKAAQEAVISWCRELSGCGLGLMFLKGDHPLYTLTPLVYIPASGTLFWENSCASGSSAAGMYMTLKRGVSSHMQFEEPGGVLEVSCDQKTGDIWLEGRVRPVRDCF